VQSNDIDRLDQVGIENGVPVFQTILPVKARKSHQLDPFQARLPPQLPRHVIAVQRARKLEIQQHHVRTEHPGHCNCLLTVAGSFYVMPSRSQPLGQDIGSVGVIVHNKDAAATVWLRAGGAHPPARSPPRSGGAR
jgi:hypothetical protein